MNRFYDLLAPVLGICTVIALLLVLVFLFLGAFRKYWIIGVYVAWELFATATLTLADVMLHGSAPLTGASQTAANKLYARLYWSNDVIVDLFRFVLVIVLIYRASAGPRRISAKLLAGLVVAMVVLPFLLFNPNFKPLPIGPFNLPFPSGSIGAAWFQSTSELLNFGAAIMNLMLWGALIASKKRDLQLLAVSAGLGVVVTGTALAYGMRHFLGQNQVGAMGFLFMNLTQLAGWLIWCWAFRPVRAKKPSLERAPAPAKLEPLE